MTYTKTLNTKYNTYKPPLWGKKMLKIYKIKHPFKIDSRAIYTMYEMRGRLGRMGRIRVNSKL